MAIGVFGLQVAYKLKRTELLSVDDTHGWFGAGWAPGVSSRADRIDFSNDLITASVRGSLSLARESAQAATGNSNYGWFGGGYAAPTVRSTVDRIDFSNDSATASVRGPLSIERYSSAATGNSNYGWFAGGVRFPIPSSRSFVDRIDFSNDSATASVRGPLSVARNRLAATGNSNYGWFAAGGADAFNDSTTVDRIDFSNDFPTASVRGPLNASRYGEAATGNSNYGWFGGGSGGAPIVTKSFVSRIDFSNDSAIPLVRGSLSQARVGPSATGNSSYGWFAGGTVPPVYSSRVDRIDFSNDTATASLRGFLSQTRTSLGAVSGQAKGPSIKIPTPETFGWFGGGTTFPASASVTSNMTRISFSNDSATALTRGQLTVARYNFAATGTSNYGWFSGGLSVFPASYLSINDRMDFSNDNSVMTSRIFMPNKYGHAAVSNSNYGWFGGGHAPGVLSVSLVDRINFNNDLSSSSPRGILSLSKYALAATGNSNYGWFGGGTTPVSVLQSTIDRINFSNDSTTASVRGPLSANKSHLAATGNSNYGWFGGGVPGPLSTVDRIDFSNDSATASIRGLLSVAKSYLAATGNSNYGWFGGGYSPAAPITTGRSTVDRVTFSNDLVTALPRGILNTGVPAGYAYMAATSNTQSG